MFPFNRCIKKLNVRAEDMYVAMAYRAMCLFSKSAAKNCFTK